MVSATGNIGKVKSGNLASSLRIKKGLKKKAFEFSTLVGVDTCMIILDPKQHEQYTDHLPIEPETYPDNLQEVHRIIQRYREYITTTTRNHECGVSSTTGVVGGSKRKRNNQELIQKNPAEIRVTSSSEQDDAWSEVQERALIQALRTLIPTEATVSNQLRCWEQVAAAVPGKKTVNQCKKKFALLMKGGFSFNSETKEEEEEEEELENEFMDFDQQNVLLDELQRMTEELEEILADCSCTSAAVAVPSSKFLVEGDKYIWPSSEDLNEILHGFGDGDHHQEDEESMFDMLHLSPPPLPLTNAFISNRLYSTTHEGVQYEDGSIDTSDKWLTTRMVEWEQIFK